MTVNSKMTALADEIRELSGTTTSKSIDAMTSDVDAANTEIAEQAELLEQIVTALDGKSGGSGGEDVTDETSAYTAKIASLEIAITALENELDGKTSAGGTGGNNIETCVVTINIEADAYTDPFYCILTTVENGNVSAQFVTEPAVFNNAVKYSKLFCFYPEDGVVQVEQQETSNKTTMATSMLSSSGMTMIVLTFELISDNCSVNVV